MYRKDRKENRAEDRDRQTHGHILKRITASLWNAAPENRLGSHHFLNGGRLRCARACGRPTDLGFTEYLRMRNVPSTSRPFTSARDLSCHHSKSRHVSLLLRAFLDEFQTSLDNCNIIDQQLAGDTRRGL